MSRYELERQVKKKYEKCHLHYKISEESHWKKNNQESYEIIKEALDDIGIHFEINNGELFMWIHSEKYIRIKERNAGRRKVYAWKKEEYEKGNMVVYKYSDIVFMIQTMTDQEVCEKIGMKPATYYRHKKELKKSQYYANLDRNKLNDKEYLESVEGNFGF